MNKLFTYPSIISILSLFFISCGGGDEVNEVNRTTYIAPGIGLGTIVAVVISWDRNKSILWAIIHGFFGWLYVIYALIVGKK